MRGFRPGDADATCGHFLRRAVIRSRAASASTVVAAFGHQPRDRFAVPGDDDLFTVFDPIEKLRKAEFWRRRPHRVVTAEGT